MNYRNERRIKNDDFRLIEPKKQRLWLELIQVAVIFFLLRVVMVAYGWAFIFIPYVDPVVYKTVAYYQQVLKRYSR